MSRGQTCIKWRFIHRQQADLQDCSRCVNHGDNFGSLRIILEMCTEIEEFGS
jgi:hypothetical protein